MKRGHGGEGVEGKCRKDNGYDLCSCRIQANLI